MKRRAGTTAVSVLRQYFRKEGQKASDFLAEINVLSEKEKLELAKGAAKEMGMSQDGLAFSLK